MTGNPTLRIGIEIVDGETLIAGAIPKEFRPPHMQDFNLTVERQLPFGMALSVAYAGSGGVHQAFRTDDVNVALPQKTPAGYLWPSPAGSGTVINPHAGQIRSLFWDENSSYNALEIRAAQRFHHGFQVQGSFTWSKSIDTGSSTLVGNAFSNSIAGLPWSSPCTMRLPRAASEFDRRRYRLEVAQEAGRGSGPSWAARFWSRSSRLKIPRAV